MGADLSPTSAPIIIATSTTGSSIVPLVIVPVVVTLVAVSSPVPIVLAASTSLILARISTPSGSSFEPRVVEVSSRRVVVAASPRAHATDPSASGVNWQNEVTNVQAVAIRAVG